MSLQPIAVYLLLISVASCMKVVWSNEKLDSGSTKFEKGSLNVGSSAVFSLEDTPSGSDDPYVSFQAKITAAAKDPLTGFVLIRPRSQDSTIQYCAGDGDRPINNTFEDFDLEAGKNILLNVTHPVEKTGRYQVFLVICDPAQTLFELNGEAIWYNPYGYLPGNIYMKLPITGVLALFYLIVTIIYMVPMIRHRQILLHIQYGIFAVMAVGVIEVSAWYFYRLDKNKTGITSFGSLMIVVFFANLKRTLTRVLLLLMAMGVGVVKWTLGNTRVKIAILAVAFMCFSFLGEMIKEMDQVAKTPLSANSQNWVMFCIYVPIALLDTCFYYWIILSIIRTMQQLTLRRQTLKLDMYKWFGGVLATTGILAAAFGLYLFILRLAPALATWRSDWVQDMYWEFLFFFTLSAICVLWRPRVNNTRYGYAEFFVADKQAKAPVDDEAVVHLETLEVVSGGQLSHRRRNVNADSQPYQTDREKTIQDVANTLSPMDQSIINATEYFDLPDDDDDEGNLSLDTQLKKLD